MIMQSYRHQDKRHRRKRPRTVRMQFPDRAHSVAPVPYHFQKQPRNYKNVHRGASLSVNRISLAVFAQSTSVVSP